MNRAPSTLPIDPTGQALIQQFPEGDVWKRSEMRVAEMCDAKRFAGFREVCRHWWFIRNIVPVAANDGLPIGIALQRAVFRANCVYTET